jgi:hypothetical protein
LRLAAQRQPPSMPMVGRSSFLRWRRLWYDWQ